MSSSLTLPKRVTLDSFERLAFLARMFPAFSFATVLHMAHWKTSAEPQRLHPLPSHLSRSFFGMHVTHTMLVQVAQKAAYTSVAGHCAQS